jgi:ABC-type lipoprotein release transport system permease subunit
MQTSTLIKRNLTHYWRTNLAVALGVATAVAVLAGALLVGDSVRASLRDLFLERLGRTDEVISSTGLFREQLAGDIQASTRFNETFEATCPLIALEAVVLHDKSGRLGSHVQVYGVDERFWRFHGREGTAPPTEREILVSSALANELGCEAEETLLIRVEKPSEIPTESLHGRKEDVGRAIRLTVREVLSDASMGEFSIRPDQGTVRAVFVSLKRLQKDLEREGRVNVILVKEGKDGGTYSAETLLEPERDVQQGVRVNALLAGEGREIAAGPAQQLLEAALKETVSLEDLGIKLRVLEKQQCLSLESDSGLIGDNLADAAIAVASEMGLRASSFFTYLANSIRAGGREVPYSLVTAVGQDFLPQTDQQLPRSPVPPPGFVSSITLNDWTASDLGVKKGDRIELEYYVWLDEGRLVTRTAEFRLTGIGPIAGAAADRDLAPDYPGITESEDFSDWDPPFPLDLKRVRPKDEKYWDDYRTTPKAFIPLAKGQELWQSRFGKLTSIRLYPPDGAGLGASLVAYRERLRAAIDPIQAGISVHSVRAQGLEASRGATDFGEYFVYFSFFLVVSALLLTALFFRLGVEQRSREIGLLEAVGFHAARIRTLFLTEGILLAALGGVAGVIGALAYGGLMMFGLRTWWVDAVGTTSLTLHVSPVSLVLGFVGGILTAMICILVTLRGLSNVGPRALLAGSLERPASLTHTKPRFATLMAVVFTLLGLLLLGAAAVGRFGEVPGFFGAGTSLLVALFCFQSAWLRRDRRQVIDRGGWWPVSKLGFRSATSRPGRSVLCIALIASATFIIVAVDSFRRDQPAGVADRKSGTGGFPLLAESLLPVVHDPNSEEGREALNISVDANRELGEVHIERFRVRPGDDASCLNLYQPTNPRILAARAEFVASGRFSFQDSLAAGDLEKRNPWLLLERELGDGAVPVVADANSMTYVLHLKLGDEFVLNRSGGPVRLRIVAALSDSVFQGELLMSEKNFLGLFPEQEGYRFFLVDTPESKSAEVAGALEEQLGDFGFDVVSTGERLAGFHRVENTYLSTFQALGGLGLILGTVGLAAVLLRNVLERRRELALLRAIGYNRSHLRIMVLAENLLLLVFGLATGTACALLAISPTLLSRGGRLPGAALGLLLMAVLAAGLIASLVATRAALRSPLLQALRSE